METMSFLRKWLLPAIAFVLRPHIEGAWLAVRHHVFIFLFIVGLYRVHQFTKVELFVVVQQDLSEAAFTELVDIQREILDCLELPYRVRLLLFNHSADFRFWKCLTES